MIVDVRMFEVIGGIFDLYIDGQVYLTLCTRHCGRQVSQTYRKVIGID